MTEIQAVMDRVTFLLSLHQYGVAMIDLEEDKLWSDLENAQNCERYRRK